MESKVSYDYGKPQRRGSGQKLIADALKDSRLRDVNQGYQYRVNESLDLFPTSGKYHNIKTNVRGHYPKEKEKLIDFVREQLGASAKISLTVRQYARSKAGECVFCGN